MDVRYNIGICLLFRSSDDILSMHVQGPLRPKFPFLMGGPCALPQNSHGVSRLKFACARSQTRSFRAPISIGTNAISDQDHSDHVPSPKLPMMCLVLDLELPLQSRKNPSQSKSRVSQFHQQKEKRDNLLRVLHPFPSPHCEPRLPPDCSTESRVVGY